ncbi:MAG: nucleoside triphosphate pyrophosphohydrolase [Clostridia bacterium]|nr:nucleoside triphosphate pyrophosphohydrolase [Clostridia bacterium]
MKPAKSRIEYNKLVRDRIPEIIEDSGKQCVYSILDNEAYLAMLDEKLTEELKEYQESKSMEELADLLEVMMAVAEARGSSLSEIEAIRVDKAEKRGGFAKRILLHEVSVSD